MKCKQCEDEGKKSRIYPQAAMSTLLACSPFYDEDGVYHHHDLNSHVQHYQCSNGHEWAEETKNKCPGCDWEGP